MSLSEQRAVEELIRETQVLPDGTHFARRGEVLNRSTMLIEGYMLRTMDLDGRRSIVSVQVPGDFVDLHAFALKRLDHDIVSVGEAKVGYVQHNDLQKVMEEQPHLARILWFSSLLDAGHSPRMDLQAGAVAGAAAGSACFCGNLVPAGHGGGLARQMWSAPH